MIGIAAAKLRASQSFVGISLASYEIPDLGLNALLRRGGKPLERPIQRALEDRMDADFSDVRIHTGAKAAEAADAIDAKAFTCGNDIVFNDGEYDPESPEGQHLLAHELAHVKQQTGAAISMMPQEGADLEIDPDPQLEREADEAAEQALSDGPVVVNRMGTNVHIQRMPDAERLEQFREQQSTNHSSDADGIPADPEVLAREVEKLRDGQEKMMEALTEAQPGAASEGDWLTAGTKGVFGSLAGLGTTGTGAALGSVVPGIGTTVGAIAGAAVSGLASDLTKEGIDFLVDNRPEGKGVELERMYQEIREMYVELKDEGYKHEDSDLVGF